MDKSENVFYYAFHAVLINANVIALRNLQLAVQFIIPKLWIDFETKNEFPKQG